MPRAKKNIDEELDKVVPIRKRGKAANDDYNASSIALHAGLDGVRQTPHVYILHLDDYGVFILVKEPVDNSIDEMNAGHGKLIKIIYDKATGTVWVCDEGRGLPVDKHSSGKSGMEVALCNLNAGAKTKDTAYKKSIGINGMGVAITNALSATMQAWSYRNKSWHTQRYVKGKPVTKLEKTSAPKLPFKVKHPNKGTIICFQPDLDGKKPSGKDRIFDKAAKIDEQMIKNYLQLAAYINPKGTFQYITKDESIEYHEPDGMKAFVNGMIEDEGGFSEEDDGLKPYHASIFEVHTEDVDLAVRWTSYPEEKFISFANGTNTKDGGTHVQGFYKALVEALKPFKPKKGTYRIDDLKELGAIGVMNVSVSQPRFHGQTKEKLTTEDAADLVYAAVYPAMKAFFDKNKTLGKRLVQRAIDNRTSVEQVKLGKVEAAQMKVETKGKVLLPPKLVDINGKVKDPDLIELFLVEGDSAGGTAKKARNSDFQMVLPLRGKPQNVYKPKKKTDTPFANREIQDIFKSIGYDPSNEKNPWAKRRVGKIIILTDPDHDGSHIDILTMAAIYRVCPEAYDAGMIFLVKSELYVYSLPNSKIYGASKKDILKKLGNKPFKSKYLTRIKGWGEVGPAILEEVAFNPKTRNLIQVTGLDLKVKEAKRKFDGVVREDTAFRKELLGISR